MQRHKGITKLDPQKYQVRVRGTDPRTGKRRDIKRTCRSSLQSALAMQSELTEQIMQGGPGGPRARVTLTDYSRSWLARRVATITLRPRDMTAKQLDHVAREISPSIVRSIRHHHIHWHALG